jgi:GTP-binding protein Era
VLVLNKIDLISKSRLLPLMEQVRRWHDFAAIVPVSATTGDGVEHLEGILLEQMPEGEPGFPADYLTDQPERALVAETVREKVLQHTHAELPFSTAVVVDEFDEAERDRLLRLYCTIFVETESQKPIVIGRGGEMIKRIGTEARHDLEKFFATRVFLDLRVKVNPDWRDNDRVLDDIGVPKAERKGNRPPRGTSGKRSSAKPRNR